MRKKTIRIGFFLCIVKCEKVHILCQEKIQNPDLSDKSCKIRLKNVKLDNSVVTMRR